MSKRMKPTRKRTPRVKRVMRSVREKTVTPVPTETAESNAGAGLLANAATTERPVPVPAAVPPPGPTAPTPGPKESLSNAKSPKAARQCLSAWLRGHLVRSAVVVGALIAVTYAMILFAILGTSDRALIRDIFVATVWPLAILGVAFALRRELSSLISRVRSFRFCKNGLEFEIGSDDATGILDDLVREMTEQPFESSSENRESVLRAVEKSIQSVSIQTIFPGFDREDGRFKDPHEALRELRHAQVVTPVGGGKWKSDSIVALRSFGRIMLRRPDVRALLVVPPAARPASH